MMIINNNISALTSFYSFNHINTINQFSASLQTGSDSCGYASGLTLHVQIYRTEEIL